MAEYQITSWRELPSLVTARDGNDIAKVQLAARFQLAIDEAAMRLGDTGSEDYLAGWTRSEWTAAQGTADEVVSAVSGELEQAWPQARIDEYLDALLPNL